jgi:hypothetical protein
MVLSTTMQGAKKGVFLLVKKTKLENMLNTIC